VSVRTRHLDLEMVLASTSSNSNFDVYDINLHVLSCYICTR